jgi:hypothetical protein
MNRMYGLDICDDCRLAPSERVGGWASLFVEERWDNVRRRNRNEPVQIISVIARGSVALPAVSFGPEHLGWLRRLFAREVQVGDPLFDDAVWVATSDHEATARLLASEGVQSAVLEAVAMSAELRLRGKEVFVRTSASSSRARAPGEVGVLAVSILHHATTVLA